jgi:alpha-beta hydrolase superfamily lysophospholipase
MGKKLIVVCLAFFLTACSGLFFYPSKQWVRTPADLGLEYRDITLSADDGTQLSAWWLPAVGKPKGTVVFLHGNAENISTHIGSVYWLPEQGYQVLLLDYRGFGRSQGVPELPEVFDDIRAGFTWLKTQPDVASLPVFLLAQSLGASMGGYVAATDADVLYQLDGVVLDAGFASYSVMAQEVASRHWLTWLFQYPAAWSMPSDYDLQNHIAAISPAPLLIIHGTQDQVVPFENATILYQRAAQPKTLLSYDGAHIDTFNDMKNRQTLLAFFEKNMQ